MLTPQSDLLVLDVLRPGMLTAIAGIDQHDPYHFAGI
jgi:hypothetical protein